MTRVTAGIHFDPGVPLARDTCHSWHTLLPTCPGAPLAGGPPQPAPDPERAAAARPLREHPHHQGQTLLQTVGRSCRYFLLIVDRNDCRRSSSNLSTKKRPSWCQDLPSSSLPLASSLAGPGGGAGGGAGEGWSPRGRSIDLRACGAIKSLGKVEEGAEVVALNL